MAGDKTYIEDSSGNQHRATRTKAVTPESIVWSSNPNDYTVQVRIDGKWHRAILTYDVKDATFFDNINIDKALVTGGDGKTHTALIVSPEASDVVMSPIPTDEHSIIEGTTTGETVVNTYSENWSNVVWQDNVNVYKVLVEGSDGKKHTALLTTKGGGGSVEIIVHGTNYIVLPDAVANSLAYLKAFGGTEQRNIPAEYTQLEYIESDGNQYIDTGVTGYTDIELDIKYRITQNNSAGYWAIYGRWENDSSPNLRHIYDSSFSQLFLCNNETGSASPTVSVSATPLNTDIVETMDTDGWYINNTFYARSTPVRTSNTASILLFNRYARSENGFIGRVYYFVLKRAGTVLFNGIPARRNSDNVLGMYDTVTGNFFTNAGTGDFTAGGEAVPTPDTPMDIVCNNGVLKVNLNLYWTEYHGYQLSQVDGITLSTNAAVNVSGAVDCRTIKSFKITTASPQGSLRIFKYKADNTFIDANSTANIGDIVTVEDNVGYFRIQYNFSSGSVGTQNILIYDSAYGLNEIYADGTAETINVHSKNLFDKNDVSYTNSTILADGSIISAENISVFGYIPVQPNTTYTYSSTTNSARAYNKRMVCFDANKNYIASIADTTGNPSGPFSITGTTPANTRYVRVACSNDQISTAQIEQGSTATAYEPYFDGGTATAEMLLKVGDYQDEQEILSGAITRNVGVKVLDGTEDWTQISGTNYASLLKATINMIGVSNATCLMTSLNQVLHADINTSINCFSVGANYLNCKLNDNTTITQFKQFLADQYANGTPVIIVYPLATPTTKSVAGQTLQVQQGDNVVEITQASLDNLELEAKYQAAVSLTIQEVQDANLDPNVEVTIN